MEQGLRAPCTNGLCSPGFHLQSRDVWSISICFRASGWNKVWKALAVLLLIVNTRSTKVGPGVSSAELCLWLHHCVGLGQPLRLLPP